MPSIARFFSFGSKKQAAQPLSRKGAAGAPAPDATWIERLPNEAALLASVGIALFLFAALLSFNANDPGLSSSGAGGATRNLVGTAGAWIANGLLSCVGFVAYLSPFAVLWLGSRAYRGFDAPLHLPFGVRATAWFVAALSLAGLAAMYSGVSAGLPQGGGGIAGSLLGNGLTSVLNPLGATLLLLTLAVVALPLAMIFSWLSVLDFIGSRTLSLIARIRSRDAADELPPADPDQSLAEPPLREARRRKAKPDALRAMPELDLPMSLPPDGSPALTGDDGLVAVPPLPRFADDENSARAAQFASDFGHELPLDDEIPSVEMEVDAEADIEADDEALSPPWLPTPAIVEPAPRPVPVAAIAETTLVMVKPKKPVKPDALPIPVFNGEPLPPLYLLDPPKPGGRRYTAEEIDRLSRELERHLASFGVKGTVVDAMPGPVITRFELQPASGVKGLADHQPVARSGAGDVCGLGPRGRGHRRQERHRSGDSEPEARDGQLVGNPRVERLYECRLAADHGHGQGHRRQSGGGRHGQDAASAGRRYHRFRQVGGDQRDDPVDAVQGDGRSAAPDPDRPEDAGTLCL